MGPVALEQSRGKKRPPRAAARQPAQRDVVRAREGDGNRAKSVTLGAPHGRIRPPRRLLRHLRAAAQNPATPVRPHLAFRYHVAHED